MNVIKSKFVYHLMAIITVAIWGTTFVSTKILIQHGLSPSDIFGRVTALSKTRWTFG